MAPTAVATAACSPGPRATKPFPASAFRATVADFAVRPFCTSGMTRNSVGGAAVDYGLLG